MPLEATSRNGPSAASPQKSPGIIEVSGAQPHGGHRVSAATELHSRQRCEATSIGSGDGKPVARANSDYMVLGKAVVGISDPEAGRPQLQVAARTLPKDPVTANRAALVDRHNQVSLENVARLDAIFKIDGVTKGLEANVALHLYTFTSMYSHAALEVVVKRAVADEVAICIAG